MRIDFPAVLHGGDYNPEQFPREVWDEDVRLMQMTGVNIATLPVFGWGNLQLDEETWNWEWLDTVIEKLHAGGIRICLATATAATPHWVDQKYPDILRTEWDGRKRKHGARHSFCPHSPNFRRLSVNLARKMAERYGKHPAVLLWHVSNEYGNYCFCDLCSAAFREWLKKKYGTLAEVNHRWNMAFWGQTLTDWSQIEAPIDIGQQTFAGLKVDYDRFQSESILDACRAEIEVLREITPDIPITTNMMGTHKGLDYFDWAKDMDIISWDSYPARSAKPADIALRHALMRGLKAGQSWMLMEQTPSQQNWQAYNSLKRPGIMRLWSYQAMAHGADAIMYFQWRRSPGGQEMLHGAVVEHASSTEARVFKEVAALGAELKSLGKETLEARVKADVAMVFDWNAWWALEYSSGPTIELKYVEVMQDYYRALFDLGVTVDFVAEDGDFSGYKLVLAPVHKMVKPGFAERVKAYVEGGGNFLSTFFSGITDETDRAFPNGYPGPLRDILGVWVEETDVLAPGESNFVRIDGHEFPLRILCDLMHLEGAEALATYGQDFYAGMPLVTRNLVGEGRAYYIGAHMDHAGLVYTLRKVLGESAVEPVLPHPVEGVEAVWRSKGDSDILFLLNHREALVDLPLPEGQYRDLLSGHGASGSIPLEGRGVLILKKIA